MVNLKELLADANSKRRQVGITDAGRSEHNFSSGIHAAKTGLLFAA